MAEPKDYEFLIDTFTLETMPMARLAQYLSDLAVLMGHKTSVHLLGIERGSVKPKIRIDAPDLPKVSERLRAVRAHSAPPDAMRAYRAIDDRLARDNAKASLLDPTEKGKILEFPGRDRIREIQPFTQSGTLDGTVMTVGGKDNPPTVHLQEDGKTVVCHASKALIKRIARHIYGTPIRVTGLGRWERSPDGDWNMVRFTIHDFSELTGTDIMEIMGKVRSEGLSKWGESVDALEELHKLRHGDK